MKSYLENATSEVEKKMNTFLLFTSELGASDGSGIKLAIMAKNMTPPKNCTTKYFKYFKSNRKIEQFMY